MLLCQIDLFTVKMLMLFVFFNLLFVCKWIEVLNPIGVFGFSIIFVHFLQIQRVSSGKTLAPPCVSARSLAPVAGQKQNTIHCELYI